MDTRARTRIQSILIFTIFCLTFTFGEPGAVTVIVPDDQPTIQQGIDAASAGDTVAVRPGTYCGTLNKNLDFGGKDIVLRNSDSVLEVVIDCEEDGRGFYFHSAETPAAEVHGITVRHGSPGYNEPGGAILLENRASPTIVDCCFDSSAAYRGGGISCDSFAAPAFIDCSVTDNAATTWSGGGGIYCVTQAWPSFTGCTVSGNTIDAGGSGAGGLIYGGGKVFDGCTFTGNHSPLIGGGLFVMGGGEDFTIRNCEFSDNSASNNGGFKISRCTAFIENCTISGNIASLSAGGGGFLRATPVMTDCVITGNAASSEDFQDGGGGLVFYDSTPILTRCVIADNESSTIGGGIELDHDSAGFFTDCVIENNTAHRGGGVHNRWDGIHYFYSCEIRNNSAVSSGFSGGNGGGFYGSRGSEFHLTNCLVTGNTASGNGARGGAFYLEDSSPELMNCTLTGNTAFSFFGDPLGGAFYCDESDPYITNCILWSDEPDEIFSTGSLAPTVHYSDIEGGWLGFGNIDEDPLFADPGSGDYHLAALSPCIDSGTDSGAPADDFEGDPRPSGGGWDMGADEYVCDLSVVLSGYPSIIEPSQTLSFTAAAVNECEDPHSFDEAEMVIAGPASLAKMLYDGASITVPAGHEVSAPVNLYVPPTAPAGIYTITVTIYRTFMWSVPIASDSFGLEVLE